MEVELDLEELALLYKDMEEKAEQSKGSGSGPQ